MKPIYKLLTIALFTFASISQGFGQCSNFDDLYPTATQTTTSNSLVTISTIMYGGDYCVCDVTAGETYTWTTCGDTDFDTQLTLWDAAHTTSYAYNDDDCGSQSTITWTATFTGQVHVLVSEYSCSNNTTSMTLQWACTTCGTGPCASATSMTCGTTYTGTLGTSGTWDTYTDCGFTEPGEEAVFSFTPTVTGDYTFSGANAAGDPDYFLMSDCDNTSTNLNGACWGVGDITATLTAGVTYYVIVDNYSSSNTADYELSVDCSAATTISTCTGTFTDSGGSAGTYSANEDWEVTYCPSSGGNIQMNFTSFDLETGYDWLEVYDGDNTSAPSLGVYDNSVPLSGIVSATGFNATGCLTFVFHSDGSGQYDGWEASISCSNPCQDVLIDVVSTSPVINTVGTVDYIDLCQGDAMTLTAQGLYPDNGTTYTQSDATSTFLWSFGDGSTATGATVTHTYADAEGFDVNLTITDINGCTNINDLGIRARVSTTPIFSGTNVVPDPVCTGNPITLNGTASPVTAEVVVGATVAGTVFLPDGSGVTYTSGLHFDNFTPGQTVTSVNDVADVCADMEHSYLGDLEAWLECPDGSMMELFDGYNGSGGSQFLGEPVDDDASMTPGTAYTYCWDPSVTGTIDDLVATAPTYTYTDNDGNTVTSHTYIPGGTYEASGAWTDLLGCPLNGTWTIHITDHLGSDNGYIFQWGINFDPSLYPTLWDYTPSIVTESWSGPDVTNSSNPGAATPMTTGTNSYVYTVTDDFGCTYDTTINITVNGFEYNTASTDCSCNGVCDGTATVNITSFVTPVSYSWSNGAGNVNSVSGLCAGTYTVTIDDGFCTAVESFTISEPAAINLSTALTVDPICEGDNTTISANATGGAGGFTYSWDNALPNGASHVVSPSVTTTYNVTATDASTCTATASVTVNVDAMPDATITPVGPLCTSDAAVVLTAVDAGGVWSGTGVSGNSFDPSVAGAGTHTVTYTITNGVCTDTDNINIVVDPMPDATITPQADLCESDAAVALIAVDAGGTWSGAGVSGSSFDPAVAGAGDHIISYTITIGSCSDSDNITIHVDAMPDATITPVGPLCTSDAAVALTAVDAGGVWSGTGVSGNSFDPSVAGAGTHAVTYTITNGVCTDTDNINIVVDPMPDATITPQADLCENDAAVTLIAVDAGGTWSGAGVSGSSFDPAVAGAGDHIISYAITVGSCSDSDNITIHVDAMPDATITPVGPLCTSDAAVALTAVDAGGVWSGTGVSGNSFDPSVAGAGTHAVTYTITNGVCTDTDNINIVVDPMPDATITPQADLCENDAAVALIAVDAGGTWSGAGVSGSSFDPAVAGAGDHIISYTITVGSCSDSDNITIHVDAMPDATITPVGPLCTSDAAVVLTAVDAGGVWSGTGVSGNSFDPSVAGAGTHTVTYTITNGVCTDTDNINIVVDPMPNATITPQADLCENDAAVALIAVDAGGTWSGAGVSGSSFDPAVAGAGDHIISYTITVGSCSDSDNISIHVDAMPDATITPVGPLCTSDAAVVLTAVDAGGVWSGTGVSGNSFDPSVAGAGTHAVTYTITNGVCTDTDNINIVVDPMPDATITPQADLCEDDAAVALIAVDAGGTWSGAGVSGSSFDPAVAGAGDHIISYTITVGSCSDSDNISIHVDAMPDATITPVGPLCTSDAAVVLTAVDAGGVWSGTGVSGNSFDPSVAGAGTHTVTYTITNGVCTDTDNINIVVDPMPDATITPQADLCENDAAVALIAVDAGGTWSGAGVSGSSFDPAVAGAGDHIISYTITVGSCSDSDNISIHVDAMPDATITPVGPLCTSDAAVVLTAVDAGGVWSGTGVSGNSFDPSVAGAGTHTVTYTITNGVCTDTDNINILVDDFLDATITPQADLCESDASVTLTAVDAGGVWSGTGVAGSAFDPAIAGAGDHVITYVVGIGVCSDTDTETIHVDAMPDATITPQADLCIADAAVVLNAATAGGVWSGTGVSGNTFDPAVAGAGDHIITYVVSNGVCTDTDTETIHVDAMPDATITPQADLCENDAAVTLNAVDAGGIWSGAGVVGNTFNPAAAGSGDHIITYVVSNGVCTDTDTETIHVDAMPDATITPQADLCIADAAVALNAATIGGVWSGTGVSGNTFDPAVAGAGDHIITYVVSNGVCTDTDTETIHVDAMPDATITPQADLCENDAAVTLNAVDAGGVWSGTGVSGNTFDPTVAGAGDHIITYVVSNGVCTDTDTETIHVDAMPDATITPQADLCIADAAVALNAATVGGVWSGTGVVGNTFDPTVAGAGDHIITYVVSNGVCTDTDTETIHVDAMPDATITPQADLCENDAAVTLNAVDAGGVWSGTGVVGNTFDPAAAGPGDHVVTYTITNGVCSDTDTETIHVDAMPDATITPQADLCIADAAVALNAATIGGVWSGTGVSGNTFDPAVAGAGDHVITYVVSNGVCTDTDSETIHVDAMPDASITPQADLCENDAAVTLNAVDAGGVWSGTGVVGNTFDPAAAGPGNHIITYVVSNGVCTDTDTETIHVDAMPDATITPQADLCIADAAVALNAATAGGVWSGTGVVGNTFDPAVAGAGDHIITYVVSNGVCTDTDSETIHVDAMPDATITPQVDLCENDAAVTLNAADAGGVWSGTGVAGSIFNPALAGAGDHLVTYAITNGVCSDTDTETIHVDAMPDASITPQADLCVNESSVPLVAATSGGVWTGSGIMGSSFVPSLAGPGDHAVTYTVDNGVCTDLDNIVIHVDAVPDSDITGPSDLCVDAAAVILTSDVTGGTWSGDGITNPSTGQFTPSVAGVGIHTISYTLSNGVCTATGTMTIEVHGLPTISIDNVVDPLCNGELTGSITVSSPGSYSPDYVWTGYGTGPVLSGVGAGTYTVVVSDFGCESAETVTLVNPAALDVTITDVTNVTCNSFGNGSAVAVGSGGTGTLDYFWSNNTYSAVLSGVPAGSYVVTVEDDNECQVTDMLVITEPEVLTLEQTISPVMCGLNPGSCSVTPSGGNGGYSYDWSEYEYSGPNLTGIGEGLYTVEVSDVLGCSAQTSMYVGTVGTLSVVISEDQAITCFGESDARLSATALGAMDPLTYQWSTSSADTLSYIEGLESGIYSVMLKDDLGCVGNQTHHVEEPLPIHIDVSQGDVSCFGGDDGWIHITPSQGTGPYTCIWADQPSGTDLSGLSAGTYNVIVSDFHNCEIQQNVVVSQPATPLRVDLLSSNVSCFGSNDGRIAASGMGGTAPYEYEWVHESYTSNASDIQNLGEGFYSLMVTDAKSCTSDTIVMIQEPPAMMVSYESVNPTCIGNNDGSIDMVVVGGTEPYIFMWDTYTGNLQYLDGLYEGSYEITVQDNNGCEFNLETITIMDVPEECLRIPDAFTPNGDDNNDNWIIENFNMFPNARVQVFNRWGQVLYTGHQGDDPWDGKNMNGNFVPTGTYLYVIELFNGTKPKTGSVTVIY